MIIRVSYNYRIHNRDNGLPVEFMANCLQVTEQQSKDMSTKPYRHLYRKSKATGDNGERYFYRIPQAIYDKHIDFSGVML